MKTSAYYKTTSLTLLAFSISFFGSLPPGATNMMTIELSAHDRYSAFMFALGCALGETVYVGLCVMLMDRLLKFRVLLRVLGWISFGILIGLAIITFTSAIQATPNPVGSMPEGVPFFVGLMVMLLNPVQVPFWLGWITILLERRIIKPAPSTYMTFTAGTIAGAIAASLLFIVTGSLLDKWIRDNHSLWQFSLGLFLLAAAGYQLRMNLVARPKPFNQPKFNLFISRKGEGRVKSPAT